mmetsp:Transcript_82530/g.130484  ORF Transcript_82530/g.130484 Transcript_82530/m.130484 type:complete len:214 (-) Transcript_82530:14-655(-)
MASFKPTAASALRAGCSGGARSHCVGCSRRKNSTSDSGTSPSVTPWAATKTPLQLAAASSQRGKWRLGACPQDPRSMSKTSTESRISSRIISKPRPPITKTRPCVQAAAELQRGTRSRGKGVQVLLATSKLSTDEVPSSNPSTPPSNSAWGGKISASSKDTERKQLLNGLEHCEMAMASRCPNKLATCNDIPGACMHSSKDPVNVHGAWRRIF